jgi:CBS domain-containing protein
MGFLRTMAAFGIGYGLGAFSGRQGGQRLAARMRQLVASRGGGAAGESAPIDVRQIRDVMTASPDAVRTTATLQEAARLMKDKDIGDILVEDEEGRLVGIVTDRDVAIRATAEGANPSTTRLEGVYTRDITSLAPTDSVHDAARLMRSRDIRRLPVVENGRAVGIVSLGDISVETAPSSLLADISTASPDR